MPRFNKLMQSPKNERILNGYISGLAHYLGVDTFPLRFLFILLALTNPFFIFASLLYLTMQAEEYDPSHDKSVTKDTE